MLRTIGATVLSVAAHGALAADIVPPAVPDGARRAITVEDVATLRGVGSLSVSPDGRRFAVWVHHADPAVNAYRTGWFVGAVSGGPLTYVGDGGEARPKVMYTGHVVGDLAAGESRWSPDGRWIAYTRHSGGETQLWRSRVDGTVREQLTHNAGDVRDFAWRADGRALFFTVSPPRADLAAQEQARAWQGYRFDEDLWQFSDFLLPQRVRAPETDPDVRIVSVEDKRERNGGEADRAAFERLRAPAKALPADLGKRFPDDKLTLCSRAAEDQVVCVRENASVPAQIVRIDVTSGDIHVAADLNPEFRNIALGRVERFEWDTPTFAWNEPGGALAGLYPLKAYGYIIYPPDFDPSKRYPVFIDPYVAQGFAPLGGEHALHVYAAHGFVVLRTAFPLPIDRTARGIGMKQLYSAELGFPHLTMLIESTLRGLDAAGARGFIDMKRVGIGGVSHGTFVPLYMMQKHDRIAAISISSPTWGPFQYYSSTRKARDTIAAMGFANDTWAPRPDKKGRAFWRHIDIAEHVEAIEAPILMHLAAHETYTLLPLIRHLADANRPYDAYVFTEETHVKWQAAHLYHIMRRNLDWFRFWLQDHEDPDPAKAEQYARWHPLRELQREALKRP